MTVKNAVVLGFALEILSAVIAGPAMALEWKDLLPPSEQAKQRDDKMFSVGLPVTDPYNMPGHWQFRPTQKLTLGVCYMSENKMDTDDVRLSSIDRKLQSKTTSTAAYFQFFPLKGGFYIGAGAELREGTYRLMRPEVAGGFWTNADIEESAGTVQAIYGGPSFGFNWIWENGFSFGFDISKRKRFTDEVKVTKTESAGVNTYEGDIKSKLIPESSSGSVMLGYSF